MNNLIISGISTDVGKTVVAAILATLFKGDYWKPVQTGAEHSSDIATMYHLLDTNHHHIFAPAYSLKAPLSPHHAARLENVAIDSKYIIQPKTTRRLIIEGVGGIMVPLNINDTTLDLFKQWKAKWVIVSKHYLGSINHTLLTIDTLKRHNVDIAGIIFNGPPNPDSEAAILNLSKIPYLASLLPEKAITPKIIQKYAQIWYPQLTKLIH